MIDNPTGAAGKPPHTAIDEGSEVHEPTQGRQEEVLAAIHRAWTFLTDDRVVGATPDVARYFLRCETCGRVFMHFWGCKAVGEKGRTGCRCGCMRARIAAIPEWQAALLLGVCYVWRRVIQKRQHWDPRMPVRRVHVES